MAKTLVTFTVQAVVEHEDWDGNDECPDYERKRGNLITDLEAIVGSNVDITVGGNVDVTSEDLWD